MTMKIMTKYYISTLKTNKSSLKFNLYKKMKQEIAEQKK